VEARSGLLVISPHLDDAVFACGEALSHHPGARVTTVFAGTPPPDAPLTAWDRDCGFASGQEAIALRREEDRAALTVLGAHPCWLELRDQQYVHAHAPQDARDLRDSLAARVEATAPGHVLLPLGLFHSDHVLASNAVLAFAQHFPGIRWTAYEDALYRRLPGLVQRRLQELQAQGWEATPEELPGGRLERKRRAVACYASQLRGLGTAQRLGHADAFARERYWALARSLWAGAR
jgi:LmbE family N-acetylglucosaminyl deacetylase